MGETLGISVNVFEKVAREKDRKERLKRFDEWQRLKIQKQKKISGIRKQASVASVLAMPEDLDDPIYNAEDSKSFGFSDYNMSPYKSCKSLSSAKMPPKSPKCMSSKAQSMKSIDQSMASAASIASFDENGSSSNQVQPQTQHLIQPQIQPPVQVVKKESVVVKQQPKSVRSPSLPPMTLPLNLTATTSNPTNGSSAVIASETLCATSISNSQFPLDENQKSTRCGGNCLIL